MRKLNRFEIVTMLRNAQIEYQIVEHPAAETVEDIEGFGLPGADYIVKNLFLRDDKKRNYFLIVVKKNKMINLKELRNKLNTRPLSFASENDLFQLLGLKKGSVTPLGILNDMTHGVQVILDEDVLSFSMIGVHPNDNTATVW